MTEVSPQSIVDAFDELGVEMSEGDVVDRLIALCDIYGVDEEKLSTEYIAFTFKMKYSSADAPTIDIIQEFENDVLKNLQDKKTNDVERGIKDVTNFLIDKEEDLSDDELACAYNVKKTPTRTNLKRQITPDNSLIKKRSSLFGNEDNCFSPTSYKPVSGDGTPNSQKYHSRKNAGRVQISFSLEGNPQVNWMLEKHTMIPRVKIFDADNSLIKPRRFMYESLRDKGSNLDETIWKIGDVLIEKNELNEPQDFTETSPDSIVCMGRICCDSPDGKLNAHSILLQGSQYSCNGKWKPFDPTRLESYSFFPGQIVLSEATNPNGSKLYPTKIYTDASPSLPVEKDSVKDEALSVFVACGPYTISDNLEYEPLKDLLKSISNNKPHVAILIGPFVDDKQIQNLNEKEDLEESLEEIYDRVMTLISESVKDLPTQVIIVSSFNDVSHISVYPTPPYPKTLNNGESMPENVVFFSDPSMISINGVIFGITSADILFHLGKEEVNFPTVSGDRLRRLCNHVIQQRSFYPLFPPNETMSLDVESLEVHGHLKVQPHVLILPSDLLHFFKDINNGIVVNPSRLIKGNISGVYARLQINPSKTDDQPFAKRVIGEIVKI